MAERKRAKDEPVQTNRKSRDKDAAHNDEMLDEAIDESFPASDPPSATQPKRGDD